MTRRDEIEVILQKRENFFVVLFDVQPSPMPSGHIEPVEPVIVGSALWAECPENPLIILRKPSKRVSQSTETPNPSWTARTEKSGNGCGQELQPSENYNE